MARAKTYCKGKKQDGTPCNNWALQGSYYCQHHKGQATPEDRQQMQENQSMAGIILLLIVVVGFILSMAFGCEQEFVDWLGR